MLTSNATSLSLPDAGASSQSTANHDGNPVAVVSTIPNQPNGCYLWAPTAAGRFLHWVYPSCTPHPTLFPTSTCTHMPEAPAFLSTFLPPYVLNTLLHVLREFIGYSFVISTMVSPWLHPSFFNHADPHTIDTSSNNRYHWTGPFVVGRRFILIPPKLVQTIVGG